MSLAIPGVYGNHESEYADDDEPEVPKVRRKSRGEVGREKVIKSHFSRIGSDKDVGILRLGQTR